MTIARPVPRHSTASLFAEHDEYRQGTLLNIGAEGSMAYHRGMQTFSDGSYATSLPTTSYDSPQPSHVLLDDWQRPYLLKGESEFGVWRQYVGQNGLEEPTLWPYRSSDYPQRSIGHSQHSYPNPQIHERSPLMLPSDHSTGRQTPQETLGIGNNLVVPRTTVASKRKASKKSKEKAKRAALEKPLSELTREFTDIPVRDTEAWVNRPIEERKAEKRNDGSIKRPSNSFMLYRSAYTERCRELEKSKNHQDISSIAGASWAIETPEIKNQFEEWAKVERENHQKAFPDYKFQPQTQAAKDRKRKRTSGGQFEELSDPEDPTYYQGRGSASEPRRSTRVKQGRVTYREYSDSPTLTSQDEANTPEPYMLSQNASYFDGAHPGKPPPYAVDRFGQHNAFYVTSNSEAAASQGGYGYPAGEEYLQYYHHNDSLDGYGASSSPPIGLPGASHDDLIGDLPMNGGHIMLSSASLLDPELVEHDQSALVSLPVPGSARSTAFHANDYLLEDDGNPYLSQLGREDGL